MADPVLELQDAIITRLKADAGVAALVSSRVADIPKGTWARPYIAIGPSNFITDDYDCVDGGEAMIQVDCWSDATVLSQVRQMADAVRVALRNWTPTLATNRVVSFDHLRTDYIQNGAIKQAAVRFTVIVDAQ